VRAEPLLLSYNSILVSSKKKKLNQLTFASKGNPLTKPCYINTKELVKSLNQGALLGNLLSCFYTCDILFINDLLFPCVQVRRQTSKRNLRKLSRAKRLKLNSLAQRRGTSLVFVIFWMELLPSRLRGDHLLSLASSLVHLLRGSSILMIHRLNLHPSA